MARQRRRRLRLRTRIAAAVVVAVTVSMVTVSAVAFELERHGTEGRFVVAASSESETDLLRVTAAVQAAKSGHGKTPLAIAAAYLDMRGPDSYAALDTTDPSHPQCAGSCSQVSPYVRDLVSNGGENNVWVDIGGSPQYATIRVIDVTSKSSIVLVEYYDFSAAQAQLSRLRTDLVWLDLAGLGAAVLFGLLVAAGVVRPMRRAARAAERFGAGELDTRIPVRGSGELAELATSFNAMSARLSDTLRDLNESQTLQQRFVSDVSHELRTPLTAMLAAGDGLDSADPQARDRSARLVQAQTRRMSELVEDLLEMSRFDAGQAVLVIETTNLVELVRDVVRTVAPDADVRVSAFGDVTAEVDARRVHAILRNLIGNALQHGAPPVDVLVDGRGDAIVITVADDGPGIDPALVPTIFDRFVRADTARTSHGSHTGLGLAISLENARLHGAALTVSTTERTAFALRLPRNPGHLNPDPPVRAMGRARPEAG
ncbi:MAG: hypothetical protein DLM58_19755 [Pseudonocardiales bacterium]|nr:MAG: hypothetical protein DLM58_19755 [Pseudonocardiales bacterium]